MSVVTADAIAAADNYRRAKELFDQGRVELIEACRRDREAVNLRGVARRAGLHQSTLYHWIVEKGANTDGN